VRIGIVEGGGLEVRGDLYSLTKSNVSASFLYSYFVSRLLTSDGAQAPILQNYCVCFDLQYVLGILPLFHIGTSIIYYSKKQGFVAYMHSGKRGQLLASLSV